MNQAVTPTGAAVSLGIGLAAGGGAVLVALPVAAPTIGTVGVGSARIAPVIESMGTANTTGKFMEYLEVASRIERPMGWESGQWVNMTTIGKAVFGTGAATAIYSWFDKSFNSGPASAVNQGP